MKFKGSIYITDPSYIALREDWADDEGFDPMDETINCPEFTDYIFKSTGIGDGSWQVYQPSPGFRSFEEIHSLIENRDYNECEAIGAFSTDSATACVVYQCEADDYNPSFIQDFQDTPHCLTLIENFDGEIEAYYDSDDELHFIGIGNICFFSA